MKFKNWLLKEEIEFLSIEEYSNLDYKTRLFFEGQQETFALSLLNNDQNLLNQLKPHIQEKHLPVAAYWLSKDTNINQVLEIMKDYVELADKNIIKANVTKNGITLDSKTTKQEPMPDFIHFANTVHANEMRQTFNNPKQEDIEIDAENLKILHQKNNITVYEANSPQACVTLGRGQSFCISKPAGTMWQSYRDSKTSTFYFVKDQNRSSDDPLRLVVVDMTKYRPELTDTNNRTGNIAEYGGDTEGYFNYLRKLGVPTKVFKNMPKTPEEVEEQNLLGSTNKDLNWFKGLNIFQQSKYIGRGHRLTDEQFDYIWGENEQKLLNQYVSIGEFLNSYQLNKIASKTSLKNSYLKAREQSVSGGSDKYTYDEYLIMNPEQQELAENKKQVDFNTGLYPAIYENNIEKIELMIKKGATNLGSGLAYAAIYGYLDVVKFLFEKGANTLKDLNQAFMVAVRNGHKETIEFLIEKGANNFNAAMIIAAENGQLQIANYLIQKGANKFNIALGYAAGKGHLDIVELLIKNGANNISDALRFAKNENHYKVVDYLEKLKEKLKNSKNHELYSIEDFDKMSFENQKQAAENQHVNMDKALIYAIEFKKFEIAKILIDHGAKNLDIALDKAVRSKNFDLVKYLVQAGANIDERSNVLGLAYQSGQHDIFDYLQSKIKKPQDPVRNPWLSRLRSKIGI